jgi:hypothetical protein
MNLICSWHAYSRRLLSFQVHPQGKNAQWQKKFEANSSVQRLSLEPYIIMSKEAKRKGSHAKVFGPINA